MFTYIKKLIVYLITYDQIKALVSILSNFKNQLSKIIVNLHVKVYILHINIHIDIPILHVDE